MSHTSQKKHNATIILIIITSTRTLLNFLINILIFMFEFFYWTCITKYVHTRIVTKHNFKTLALHALTLWKFANKCDQ